MNNDKPIREEVLIRARAAYQKHIEKEAEIREKLQVPEEQGFPTRAGFELMKLYPLIAEYGITPEEIRGEQT